jgi:hypothetical protein
MSFRAAQQDEIELARDGRSNYTLVLSRNATPSETRAADELQRFLEEMTGARLPITTELAAGGGNWVFVGRSEAVDTLKPGIPFGVLGPEGFALKTLGRHLVIAGGRERGTMYGVSTFLEKLGCRWFTREVSRIPRLTAVTVPTLNEIHQPAFEYRLPYATEALDKNWAARNKVNGGLGFPLDASAGGSIQYYPFVHSFFKLIPPNKYFADHPEYFSLIDGARRTEQAQRGVLPRGRPAHARVFQSVAAHGSLFPARRRPAHFHQALSHVTQPGVSGDCPFPGERTSGGRMAGEAFSAGAGNCDSL